MISYILNLRQHLKISHLSVFVPISQSFTVYYMPFSDCIAVLYIKQQRKNHVRIKARLESAGLRLKFMGLLKNHVDLDLIPSISFTLFLPPSLIWVISHKVYGLNFQFADGMIHCTTV